MYSTRPGRLITFSGGPYLRRGNLSVQLLMHIFYQYLSICERPRGHLTSRGWKTRQTVATGSWVAFKVHPFTPAPGKRSHMIPEFEV